MTAENHIKPSFRELLLEWYPGQVDGSSEEPLRIRIDDQTPDDTRHDFCTIRIKVHNSTKGTFTLRAENVPCNNEVEAAIRNLGGTWSGERPEKSFSITLTVESASSIKTIARKIQSVIGRGKGYLNPHWKSMVPRTAKSLQTFAIRISDFCRQARAEQRRLDGA